MPTAKEIQDATAETKVAQALALLPAKPLANNRLRLICASSSDICNRFAAVLPAGTSFAATLDPAFWSNVSSQLRVGDVVEIHSDSRGFYGTVYVRDTAKTRAQVARLEFHEFEVLAQSADPTSHRVKYLGPHMKWGIERIADGKPVREGFENQEAAELALKGMERSTSKVA
jgi:hypothetical protein